MDWAAHCAAVIPCFNEAPGLATLVDQVHARVPVVVVVDDGSEDGTAAEAERAGAVVLRHERNRGKGAALRTGLSAACQRGFAWALTLDGDGQHAPADIPAFFHCAEETGAALVVGQRRFDATAMPRLRRLVNCWMSRQLSRRAGMRLPDSQCGFRLVQLAAWAALRLEAEHFEAESELLLACARAGHRIAFVPIQTLAKSRPSKIHPATDTLRWLRWWWRTGRVGVVGRGQ